jgi:hypothetical protein
MIATEEEISNVPIVVKSKRGRKSKKELMESLNLLNIENQHQNKNENIQNIKKTLKKNKNEEDEKNDRDDDENDVKNNEVKVFKKRGRKPKGGKIIQQTITNEEETDEKQYVILHLKCSMLDLENVSEENKNSLDAYNTHIYNEHYQTIDDTKIPNLMIIKEEDDEDDGFDADNNDTDIGDNKKNNIKEIWKKIKQLECNLHVDNISKKSACFWDTCDFDTPPIYIPKYFLNGTYYVYGCFCCPECAMAYLNSQHLDRSTKTERCQLLHDVYSKIYGYKKSIKEASDPRYLLDKFFGNLSIKEYRILLRTETLYLVIDKPLTKVYPEIHEDTDDYILNNKIIPSNTSNYQIKGKNLKRKTTNKSSILSENFGIN